MGVQDLQTFLESSSVPGGTVNVELLKVARNIVSKQNGRNKKQKESLLGGPQMFSLVVDAECCIDRLYGGFFSGMVTLPCCKPGIVLSLPFINNILLQIGSVEVNGNVWFNFCQF